MSYLTLLFSRPSTSCHNLLISCFGWLIVIVFLLLLCSFFAERHTDITGALWVPFQTAAGTVTTLYKGKLNIENMEDCKILVQT